MCACEREPSSRPLVLAGAAGFGYASVVERNWFALRQAEVPVLAAGAAPLRILHISDVHLTPGPAPSDVLAAFAGCSRARPGR